MPTEDEPLRDWGLSNTNNKGWKTYYTAVKLCSPRGTAVDTFLKKLGEMRNGNLALSQRVDHNELRLVLVSIPTFGSHDAIIVWQTTNDDAAKDFQENVLTMECLCETETFLQALSSGTHH